MHPHMGRILGAIMLIIFFVLFGKSTKNGHISFGSLDEFLFELNRVCGVGMLFDVKSTKP